MVMELNVSFVFTVINKHVLSLRETAIILKSYSVLEIPVAVPLWTRYFNKE